jgi:secondary thiamine-phosphate synthase enzyme
MTVHLDEIQIGTKGEVDIINITPDLEKIIKKSPIKHGIVCVYVAGSTGALTTVEYEPGLMKDLPRAMEIFAPKNCHYDHHETWHDDNGHSHVRASFIGPSITIPIRDHQLIHGTWQQIVFLELDTSPRNRTLYIQIIGE